MYGPLIRLTRVFLHLHGIQMVLIWSVVLLTEISARLLCQPGALLIGWLSDQEKARRRLFGAYWFLRMVLLLPAIRSEV
jgi:sugar phosphate permease